MTEPFGALSGLELLFQQATEQVHGLLPAVQDQAKVGGSLKHLDVPRLVGQNVQVLFQRSLRLASLQVLFRFFKSLGDIRHGSNSSKCSRKGVDRDALRLSK